MTLKRFRMYKQSHEKVHVLSITSIEKSKLPIKVALR